MIRLQPVSAHPGSMSVPSMPKASGKVLMKYRANQTQLRVKASGDVAGRVCKFLRQRYPRKTAEQVSADTGLSPTTVASWFDRSTVPGGLAFIALINAYGPDFLASVMPKAPRWLDRAYREERQALLEAEQRRIEREIAELRA